MLTSESNSYYTKEDEIRVPVGIQNVNIPELPSGVRTTRKSAFPATAQRTTDSRRTAEFRKFLRGHQNCAFVTTLLQ